MGIIDSNTGGSFLMVSDDDLDYMRNIMNSCKNDDMLDQAQKWAERLVDIPGLFDARCEYIREGWINAT